jgi:hypothetical protein
VTQLTGERELSRVNWRRAQTTARRKQAVVR